MAAVLTRRQRLRYALETAVTYMVYGFFRILPLDVASATGGWIGRKLGPRLSSTRTARKNLAMAFPEKSVEEREKIILGMWDNLGRVAGEYAHLHRIWERVELRGVEVFHGVRDGGKPAIFCGAHIANWEIAPIAAKKGGVGPHLVYRKPNNPGVDGLLRHARDAGGVGHVPKGSAGAKEMLAVLKRNGALGVLIDQKLNEGIPVPFFGRDAMTAPAIAHFALRLGCGIYPVRIERLGGCHFRATVSPALPLPQTGDKNSDIREMMTGLNRMIEGWIRERPEQWLWIHRRWPD